MIQWENIYYNLSTAEKNFKQLTIRSQSVEPIDPKYNLLELRDKLIEARDEIFEQEKLDGANTLDYKFDLLFGLKLYSILGDEIDFTARVASNDDVWRYLSICVVPDIVHARWELKEDYFYKQPRRIWLKRIWWYIHLSWQGNVEDTFKILEKNTTDTVMQLVERPGIGYYQELYREIMARYFKYNDSDRQLFRKVLKLNTARLLTMSPELVEGGIPTYVDNLFLDLEE